MSHIKIEIETNNAAFDPDQAYEVARILRELAEKIEYEHSNGCPLRDINGNTIGQYDLFD